MEIFDIKFNTYYFALRKVYDLHLKYGFGKTPDIPSGFSETLCCDLLKLKKSSDRKHDAKDMEGNLVEIKATGSPEGKTTISNSNKFDYLIWMFLEFETDSVHIYKLPKSLFSLPGGVGRKSISLRTIANDNGVGPKTYTFQPNQSLWGHRVYGVKSLWGQVLSFASDEL